jgi:hypothetical protein
VLEGDILVHVSCECFERKIGSNYTFKSRVEYRILKLNADSFTEVLATASEKTDNVTGIGEWPQVVVQFPTDLPRPETLLNMAAGSTFFEYVQQDSDTPTKWNLRHKENT